MLRVAAILLILCGGCASTDHDTADLWYGDLRALFFEDDTPNRAPQFTATGPASNASPAPRPEDGAKN